MLRLRYSARLASDIMRYARVYRAWWLLVAVPAIALALLTISTTQVVVPYTVYTLF